MVAWDLSMDPTAATVERQWVWENGRGFNVYAGNVGTAEFDQITTHGDGAIGPECRSVAGLWGSVWR